jgi:putative chitinase
MADKKERTPERQRQVETRARRMESTSNARNWDNPEADLTKGQRVRGMARSSIADAISEKFGIVGQRASDKIKGKGGPTIGQMAKSAGKEAIAEKFGPLGKIATMGKGDKKESATSDAVKSKSDSVTQSASKQLSDLKSSNANNTIMLRNMNGSLKSIDQKLEDILFSQERMENMLNRMIMDRGASKRSNLGEANLQDPYENDPDQKSSGFNFDLDVDRNKKKTRPNRPGPKKPGYGRRLLDGARGAVKGKSVLGIVAGGALGAAVGSQLNEGIEKDTEDFKTKVYSGQLKEKLKDHPEKDKLLKAFSSMEPKEQHAFFMKYFHALAFKSTNATGIAELEKLANVKPDDEEYDADIEKLKPIWEQKNPDGTWKNKFTGPDGKEITDPEERKKFQSSRGKDLANKIAGAPSTPAPNAPTEKTPDDKSVAPAKPPAVKAEGLGSKVVQTLAGTAGGIATSPLGPFASSLGSMGGAMLGGYIYDAVTEAINDYFNPSKPSDATKVTDALTPQTAIAENQAPTKPAPDSGSKEQSQTAIAENQAPATSSASGGATPSSGGATQAGPPSAVTPSAGGDKGATPRSGSEQSLLSAAKAAGIKDPTELAQFMAQMAHESGDFKYLQEIWGPTSAQKGYEGRKDLGNTQSGDGYKFRGRGYVQLTGRANYRSFGAQIGVDLENNPDLASQPDIAARLAIAYWNTRVKSRISDFDNTRAVTRLINGGFNGLSDRQAKYRKYKEQKDLAGSGATGAGSTATPSAEGGGATAAPSPSAGGSSGSGGGEMPGVDIMGNATGMPQAGGATAAPGAGPSGGTGAPGAGPSGGATPPTLAPPGAGSTGPAAEGAGTAAGDKSGQNGMLPPSSLSPVGVGSHKAQPVAADAFKAMRAAAAKDKVDLGITDSYRSYAAQVDVKRRKPNLAATPGKSNHGWGLAFDMSFGSNQNSPGYKWMTQNASKFGFKGPLQKPFEPWHWEYKGGGSPDAMSAAGGGGQKDAAPAGAEGAGATASPSPSAGSGSGSGGSGGAEGAGGSGSMAAASPTGGGGVGPCPPAENTAKPATTPVETGADLNRRSTDIELSKSSVQPPIVVAGGTGEKAGHTVPNGGGAQEGTPISAVPEGGFAEQLASGIAGSLVESTGSNSMSMNRRAAGGSMAA